MAVLGTKFLVWCSLVLVCSVAMGVMPTVWVCEDVAMSGGIYPGYMRLWVSHVNWVRLSVSCDGRWIETYPGWYIFSNGNYYLDFPDLGPGTGSIACHVDGSWETVASGITWTDDSCFGSPKFGPWSVTVNVVGGGSVVCMDSPLVATPGQSRIYENIEDGASICFQAIPGTGYVFNGYSVDGGEWVISDDSFCLTVNDDMTVVFRFVDELSFDEDDNKRASEWWGTYERSSSSTTWEDWSIQGVNWAHFDEDGDLVYMDSTLIGSWQEHLAGGNGEVYLFTPSWSERFWVYRNGKHFGYVNESNQVVIGDNLGTVMGSFVESSDWWGGEEPGYGFSGFGGLVSGPVIANNEAKTTFWFEDEWGKRVFEVEDRFWTGFWDYPGYDPASPTTYPPEPFWKADPPDPPGEEDDSWLADLLKDFFEKYFVYDPDWLKGLAEDLRDKAARKFPFCLFWIPEKLPSSSEDVSVPLLDLSMFVGKDFKVDFYNNEYMDELAETTRNLSRYIIWLLFIFHLRDIIMPVMVID